ncbi:unnamed protein product [Lactuca saligna]|uniref:Uncharacterized protein n=1 Tax=Lactuca saligna TaxID=75948 RepID=A0AA35Y7U0_LACSI|nr:unnamed protein product [Lactuca saligna]
MAACESPQPIFDSFNDTHEFNDQWAQKHECTQDQELEEGKSHHQFLQSGDREDGRLKLQFVQYDDDVDVERENGQKVGYEVEADDVIEKSEIREEPL